MKKIHYFFDPMCGWCFGATALIKEIQAQGIEIVLHPGGLFERQYMQDDLRAKVLSYDANIEKMTGQKFGVGYKDRIKGKEKITLDSFITAQAVMVAEKLEFKGLAILEAIQNTHYVKGVHVSQPSSLSILAIELGLDGDKWQEAISSEENNAKKIVQTSQHTIGHWGIRGFPTLVLEKETGLVRLPHDQFYGNVDGWSKYLSEQ
ncbi:DsbA family protein [Vibrio sp. D404a]|uniref:DsbA family protein n=1 Tax=unclassified Vibrio TaxID=2614977 RepID=UPI002553FFB7|nr:MULTISPECIES: DsbA family protein [unclassified Vibrio]MDK9739449.1 DsbA family protein [Vibrio sp. D404a]MDK9798929.1 DsbA family protein [Vibrio sp. D449a]